MDLRHTLRRTLTGIGSALASVVLICDAATGDIAGGSSSSNPVDITRQVMAGDDLHFTGGYFQVTIPRAGTSGTSTPHDLSSAGVTQYPLDDYGSGHFVADSAPALMYRKTITGTGTLIVTNATDAVHNPSTDPSTGPHPFTGGVLLFTNPQTFSSGSAAATLVIRPNTTVAFDQGGPGDVGGSLNPDASGSRNIVNDGYLYLYVKSGNVYFGDIVNTEAGAGVVTWENGGVATNGHTYRGHSLASAGAHIEPNADFGFDNVVNLNDFSFETYGPDFLVAPAGSTVTAKKASTYSGNVYNPGIDIQVQSNDQQGIKIFSGLVLTPNGNTKKDFAPVADSLLTSYFTRSKGAFSLSIYVQATTQFGNGQTIVDYGNGLNNTAVQGNFTAVYLQTGNFESAPNSAADALGLQTLALDYSGTYHNNTCLNQWRDADHPEIDAPVAPGNFVVMNPDPHDTGRAPNHVILTCPMLAQGIVRIEKNGVLQLGDGTKGNYGDKTLTLSNGTRLTGTYSDSSGNGMLLTQLNSAWPNTHPQWSQIINDGALIVDNVPDALDMTLRWSDANVVPLLAKNQLDTIVGMGRIEQAGTLPLTLAGSNTYAGGTKVDEGATLIVASQFALGAAVAGNVASGGVTNAGTLTTGGGNRTINVPGNYAQ